MNTNIIYRSVSRILRKTGIDRNARDENAIIVGLKQLERTLPAKATNQRYIVVQNKPDNITILYNLPYGAIAELAKRHNCSKSYVSTILNGRRKAESDLAKAVYEDAELLAAITRWNLMYNSNIKLK